MPSAGTLTKLPRAEQWADQICTQLGKSVESIFDVGRLLVRAKADLNHGEWGRLFEDKLIPFSIGTAQRLMAIATHKVISNTAHGPYLPSSWRTLYELTKADPQRLAAALKDGVITPDMTRQDVKALQPSKPPKVVDVDVARFDVASAIIRVTHVIRSVNGSWPANVDRAPLITALRREADRLETQKARA